MDEVEIIDLNKDNITSYSICGYKNPKQEGYIRKLDWLKQRFGEGLRIKTVYLPSEKEEIGSIEYIPGEYAWRAVEAPGYMVIHCIFTGLWHREHKGKGYGSLLVKECLKDAEKENLYGVATVTTKRSLMAKKDLFIKNGFEMVAEAPPCFELMVKRLKDAPLPEFTQKWQERLDSYGEGLTIISSDQCAYIARPLKEITESCRKLGIKANTVRINNCREAQNAPTPYGTFGIIYNGKLVADHPVSNTRFLNIVTKELKIA